MESQWTCLRKNLGDWHGSFTQIAPDGSILSDTPTVTSLQGLDNNTTIRQVIRRMPVGEEPTEQVLQYSSLGRGILVFESGAFSQGSLQLGPFGEFGAELGLIWGDRRLRLVQLFHDRQLSQFTLIRERLTMADLQDDLPLTVAALVGEWQGEAVTIYPDWRSPDTMSTHLSIQLQNGRLAQTMRFAGQTIASQATVNGSILDFSDSAQPVQTLLLPAGASATCPSQIQPRTPFFLEVGWLVDPNLRLRMSRWYDVTGAWSSLTLVVEHRVNC